MIPRHPQCVLTFDLDDTLVPEAVYARSGFAHVGRWLEEREGIRGFGAQAISLYDAGRREKVFDATLEALGRANRAPELVPAMVEEYRRHTPDMDLDASVRALLESLRAKAYLALITDGYAAGQRAKIRALGLDTLFDHLIVTDELGREFWKPHKRAYEAVQAHFGLRDAAMHVYIADNPAKDFLAPNALGWRSIRVRIAGSLHENDATPANGAATAEIRNLSELTETLRGMGLPV